MIKYFCLKEKISACIAPFMNMSASVEKYFMSMIMLFWRMRGCGKTSAADKVCQTEKDKTAPLTVLIQLYLINFYYVLFIYLTKVASRFFIM